MKIITGSTIGVGITLSIVTAAPAHADWNCQPAYGGGETICGNETGSQIACVQLGSAGREVR